MSWLRYLEIAQLEQERVVLQAVPGHREVLGFCTEQRLEQIGQHLSPILGRRVRVTAQPPETGGDSGGSAEQAPQGGEPRQGGRQSQRREAMNLPLVQRVLEVFPDATLLDARDEAAPPPPREPAAGPEAESEAE